MCAIFFMVWQYGVFNHSFTPLVSSGIALWLYRVSILPIGKDPWAADMGKPGSPQYLNIPIVVVSPRGRSFYKECPTKQCRATRFSIVKLAFSFWPMWWFCYWPSSIFQPSSIRIVKYLPLQKLNRKTLLSKAGLSRIMSSCAATMPAISWDRDWIGGGVRGI